MLKQYIRDDHKNPIGIILADGKNIGWSLCNPIDKFDKYIGTTIAMVRLGTDTNWEKQIKNNGFRYNGKKANYRMEKVIDTIKYMKDRRMK